MAKKICIAFPRGGIIPASVMAARADVTVGAMTPIEVPEDYGRHLIDDRFAVTAEMPKKDDAKAERKAAEKAEAEKKAAAEKALAVKLAEEAVATAKAKLEATGADMVAKAAAEDELKAAEAALAGLKG